MTLSEVLPSIRLLNAFDKLRLIRILAEELDTNEDIAPLQPNKVYYMPTPYDLYGVAEKLMDYLKSESKEN